ncbi:MAG: hypothetical protein SGILL_008248, partial [Bacillariaceae sp.]
TMNSISSSSIKPARPRRDTIEVKGPEQISQKIGYVVDEFKCTHNNFQGILYAGPLAVVFLGRILLFEWTVVIKWDDVAKVQKCNEKGIENGIRIETRGKNASKYYFERFFDCSKALGVLVSLYNDSILDLTQKVIPTPKVLSRGLRRNNSDPLRISNLFNFDEEPTSMQENEKLSKNVSSMRKQPKYTSMTPPPTPLRESDEFRRISAASAPPQQQANYKRSSTYNYSIQTSEKIHIPEGESFDEGDIEEELESGNNKPTSNGSSQQPHHQHDKTTAAEIEQEWAQVLNDNDSYAEIAVRDLELPCDLDTFIKKFVEDAAECSLDKFMVANGDEDMQISDWNLEDDGCCKSRTMEYTHPVDAPMAPPMARARKEQSLRRYGDHGLVFETKTYVSDVPMTDCFFVADLVRVQSKTGENGERSVLVSMLFDIRFVKSTMFKSIIARTSKSELEKFFNELAAYLTKNTGQPSTTPTNTETILRTPAPIQPPPVSSKWSQIAAVLLVIVLSFQVWILWEMKTIHLELRQFAAQQQVLHTGGGAVDPGSLSCDTGDSFR